MGRSSWGIAIALCAMGCGDDGGGAVNHDAAIDSPAGAPAHQHYVVDMIGLPTTNMEADERGLDLDGDGIIDNRLGMLMATLVNMGLDPQFWFDKALDTGQDLMLVDVSGSEFVNTESSTIAIYAGANPVPAACGMDDPICRHQFTGSAMFTALASPVDPALTGNFVDGVLTAGPGRLTLQFVFPEAPPVALPLHGARVELEHVSETQVDSAIFAGGVTRADMESKMVPAIRAGAVTAIARDCSMLSSPPACGCPDGSRGRTFMGLFDVDHDCAVTLDEVRDNALIASLTQPDVTLENEPCFSIGVRAHAVGAIFVAPQ